MQGHLERRGKNAWRVIVELPRDPETGKRRQLKRAFQGTKKQAEAYAARLIHEQNSGIDQPRANLTVEDYLEAWLRDYAKANVRPSTYAQYESLIRRLAAPSIGRLHLADLRPLHIQSLYAKIRQSGRADGQGGLSTSTVHSLHKVLKEALQHAVDWQMLSGTRPHR